VISVVFIKSLTIFTTYALGSPDVWGPGSKPQTSPLNPALQTNSKVTITQQAVRDSGFVQ